MLRSSLIAASAVALCATSSAQQAIQAQKVISPVRDAGIYHVATGTWTRTGSTANIGTDIIYSSTAPSGYFGVGWEANVGVDEGIAPGTGIGGGSDSYLVDGFNFSYCSLADTLSWSWQLLPSFVPCDLYGDDAANCQEACPAVLVTGLPTAGACWIVTVDLAGTGAEFCLAADGGSCAPGYQGGGLGLDHFGIAHIWATGNGATTGPILDGYDPAWAPAGEGTCYNTGATCAFGNTALGAQDLFTIDDGAIAPGCYFFGGYNNTNGCGGPSQGPPAQFSMQLFTDCTASCEKSTCGVEYCDTNPNQNGNIAIDNCALDGSGNTITVTNAGTTLFSYLNVSASNGTITDPPGSQGDLCLAGSPIGRYNADLQAPGGSGTYSTDIYNGNTGGGAGNLPSPPGGALTAGSTWNFQGWQRMPAGAPTTWSNALEVLFN
jgi:hypothetical protein